MTNRGYRCKLSFKECLLSIFRYHNETGNIWSHLIGAIIFASTSLLWMTGNITLHETNAFSWFILYTCFMCYTFIGSVIYHTFYCHSPHMMVWVLRVDYSGISAAIAGSQLFPIFLAYSCAPFWQTLYASSCSILGLVGVVCSFFPFFHSNHFQYFRLGVYSGTALSGFVPLFHSYFIDSDSTNLLWDMDIMKFLLLEYSIWIFGVFLYATKIPEKYFPGKFDYWFNSHQLFHLCVFSASYSHLHYSKLLFNAWKERVHCTLL